MANQVSNSPSVPIAVGIVGDGVSLTVDLAADQYPFPANPPGKLVSAVLVGANANVASVTNTSKIITITFVATFSNTNIVDLTLTWDPS